MRSRKSIAWIAVGLLCAGYAFAQDPQPTEQPGETGDMATAPSEQETMTEESVTVKEEAKTETGKASDKASEMMGSAELDSEQIKQAQKKLDAQGYKVGSIDGVMGKKTAQAVRSFQKDHNQPVTGMLDPGTLSALGVQQAGEVPSSEDEMAGQEAGSESGTTPSDQSTSDSSSDSSSY